MIPARFARRWRLIALAVVLAPSFGLAQPPPSSFTPPTQPAPPAPSAAPIVPVADPEPIDLQTSLRLAASSNLDIAEARTLLEQAKARRQLALSKLLPDFTLGSTWLSHDGRQQISDGDIKNFDTDSLFVGGGPKFTLGLSDAVYGPLVARQLLAASSAAVRRVTNDTLLAVGEAYLQMLRARRQLGRVDYVLAFLADEKPSDLRANAKGLLPLVRDIVEAGGKDAFRSDVARLQVEVVRRQEERAVAVQELLRASRELSRLVRLDPALPLWPADDPTHPVPLPGEELIEQALQALIAQALANRPEMQEEGALVEASRGRLRAAKAKPFLPAVTANTNYGGFGGSPIRNPFVNVNEPFNGPTNVALSPSGEVHRFGPRTDMELSVTWRLYGMGLGNRAEVREQRAAEEQAQIRLALARDRVAAQVGTAYDLTNQAQERIRLTRPALFDEQGRPSGDVFRSMRLNFERIRGTEGRPLEALDSIRGLSDTLEAYVQAVSDYERARLRLLQSLGLLR